METIDWLLVADVAIALAAVAVISGVAARWARSGAWRNPLAGAQSLSSLSPIHVGLMIALYVVLLFSFGTLIDQLYDIPRGPLRPGSHHWHLDIMSQLIGAGVATLVLAVVLTRRRGFHAIAASDVAHRETLAGRSGRLVGVALLTLLIVFPLTTLQLYAGHIVMSWIFPNAAPPVHVMLEAIDSEWGGRGKFQLVVAATVLAPLSEEMFFRGLLLSAVWNFTGSAWSAVSLTALAFGFAHMSQPQDVLPLATMGAALGLIRVRYASLIPCILVHFLFNARTMAFALLWPEMLQSA